MSTTDRVTAVIDNATSTHNKALANVITRGRALSDEEAETMYQHMITSSDAVRDAARNAIDEAAIKRSFATGEQDLIGQIAEAGDAGWYAAGEASGEAANAAAKAGKWSALADSDVDRYWIAVWSAAWQAVSDSARAHAARNLLTDDEIEQRHYDALLAPWRAAGLPTATSAR